MYSFSAGCFMIFIDSPVGAASAMAPVSARSVTDSLCGIAASPDSGVALLAMTAPAVIGTTENSRIAASRMDRILFMCIPPLE